MSAYTHTRKELKEVCSKALYLLHTFSLFHCWL